MDTVRGLLLLGLLVGCEYKPRGRLDGVSPRAVDAITMQAQPVPAAGAAPARAQGLDPRSVAVLEKAIASKDYATRLVAIEAMGDARAESFLQSLEHALGDPEHDVRMAAVEALIRMRSNRALALLATVRDDTSEELDIRAVAAGALLSTSP